MPKLDFVSIRKEPNEYFNDEQNREMIANMDGEKQKNFITSLVAEASKEELAAIAKSANQSLGAFEELHGFRGMVNEAVVTRCDIFNMMECDNLAQYLLGEEQLEDADFNPDLYREFPTLFALSLDEEEQAKFMSAAIASCKNGKEMSGVAKLVSQTFAPAQGELLQGLIALRHTQSLVNSENPAAVLLDKYFNPDLVRQYWKQFCAEMDGQVDAVAKKICQANLSQKELGKIGRILEQMNPEAADKENPVSQLQAAVNKQMAAKDNSGKIVAEIGIFSSVKSEAELRQRQVKSNSIDSPVVEEENDAQKDSKKERGCLPCAIL